MLSCDGGNGKEEQGEGPPDGCSFPRLVNLAVTLTPRIYYNHEIIKSTRNGSNRLTPHISTTIEHDNNQSPQRKNRPKQQRTTNTRKLQYYRGRLQILSLDTY